MTAGVDGERFRVTVFVPYVVQENASDGGNDLAGEWTPVVANAPIAGSPAMAAVGAELPPGEEETNDHG